MAPSPSDVSSGAVVSGPDALARRGQLLSGMRRGAPFAVANGLVALSFATVATEAGFSAAAATIMSAVVFAASAQFTAVAIVAQGGSLGAALAGVALMNSRFIPMGAAVAPSLRGGLLRRMAQAQAVIDASFAMAARPGGRFDVPMMLGATLVQYAGWVGGTAVGALSGDVLGDPAALGLDAVYPAFFVVLLMAELRSPVSRAVALLGASIAIALVPWAPGGLPLLAASAAALVGLSKRAAAEWDPT